MRTYTHIYGIDVSKDTLDLFLLPHQNNYSSRIANEDEAIQQWIKTLDSANTLCVLEPTGSYSMRILYHLCQGGVAVKMVTPNQSNGFAQAQGIISKNDRQAARTLALMGQSLLDLPLYQHPSAMMEQRKQLLRALNALKKQRQRLQNQLHALAQRPFIQSQAKQAYEVMLETAEQQIKILEEQLDELTDDEYERQFKLICSIKGLAKVTARSLLLVTGGLHHFSYGRQISKFIGIVPASHYSGTSVFKKGRITKKGSAELRANLYMAARSARRYNLACKDLYERLRAKGKPHKQAMVAVMNKLIKQAHGVVMNNTDFENQYFLKFQNQ